MVSREASSERSLSLVAACTDVIALAQNCAVSSSAAPGEDAPAASSQERQIGTHFRRSNAERTASSHAPDRAKAARVFDADMMDSILVANPTSPRREGKQELHQLQHKSILGEVSSLR
jgi:hypothetical protein